MVWKNGLRLISSFAILSIEAEVFAQQIDNPLGVTSFPELIQKITQALIPVAFTVAVVTIIIAGLRFVIAGSRGDEAELKKAREIFWWTLIGTGIVVGSYALASAVYNFFKGL